MKISEMLMVGVIVAGLCMVPSSAFNQVTSLGRGIDQYNQENYEESIELLKSARQEDPTSTPASFFLGMAYKQTLDYEKALPHLHHAVTQTPRIKEALVELIFVLNRLKKTDLALKWIEVAEKEQIFPAKVAFLKGMALRDQGKTEKAVAAFEDARRMDPSMAQSVEYEVGMAYLKDKNLKAANERFKAAVTHDPMTDLATFARQYQSAIEKRMELEKPFRFTIGLFGQYDTNVVSKPAGSDVTTNITDEAGFGMLGTLRVDYIPNLTGPWLFSAGYGFSGNLHRKHSTSHDTVTNFAHISPGYNFGDVAVNLSTQYSHSLLRGPSYSRYMDQINVGPLVRTLLSDNHIVEFYTGYIHKTYFQPPLSSEEDRDATGGNAFLSWIWMVPDGTFFNLRYEFVDENADGDNWDYTGFKISANTSVPVVDRLNVQLSGDVFIQDYDNTHSLGGRREDETYNLSAGLAWKFYKNAQFILQYSRTRADSNISVYDYDRDVYTAGIEYRY